MRSVVFGGYKAILSTIYNTIRDMTRQDEIIPLFTYSPLAYPRFLAISTNRSKAKLARFVPPSVNNALLNAPELPLSIIFSNLVQDLQVWRVISIG
jgi:hypothetical protein